MSPVSPISQVTFTRERYHIISLYRRAKDDEKIGKNKRKIKDMAEMPTFFPESQQNTLHTYIQKEQYFSRPLPFYQTSSKPVH